jgi:hypothetical protein
MKIRLIVPHCVQPNGDGTCEAQAMNLYGRAIADIAGGFTATQATGGWIDDTGLLIVEPVTVFDCHVAEPFAEASLPRGSFHILAARIARELHQDCVYLEIDGHVELVRQ